MKTNDLTHRTIRRAFGFAFALLAIARSAVAQQLPAMTMPLKDGGTDHWEFYGDRLLGVDVDRGVLKLSARVNAYSLTEGKPLWRQEFDMGFKMNEVKGEVWYQNDRDRLIVGTGPLSAVTLDGKSWTLSCDQAGPVDLGEAVQLNPDRILLFGNDSCKGGFKDDPVVMMLDGSTGSPLWSHQTKGQWVNAPMGYWARVAYWQGNAKRAKTLQFRVWPLAPGPNGFVSGLAENNRWATAVADRVLIIGKRMEVLNGKDGTVIWKSPKEVDRLEGLYGPYVFLRDGDKLMAVKAGTGEPGWSMDLDKAGTTLYDAVDLLADGDQSPLGPNDLLVSEARFVSRVDLLTGQKKWTVKREGNGWYGTLRSLMVVDEKSLTAYDWETGARRWQITDGKSLHAMGDESQAVVVFAERGKREDGVYVGPFKFFAVEQATGRVVWSRLDLAGKRITSFAFVSGARLAISSETGQLEILTIADGTPAPSTGGGGGGCFPAYARSAKALQCRDGAGAIVWDRKGEMSENQEVLVQDDLVVWAAKSGEVEVIARADGASRWKGKSKGNPRVWVSKPGTQLVVPGDGNVTVVSLR